MKAQNVLDNPIWNALTTRQSHLGTGGSLARRFHSEIGPLSGLLEQSDTAYAELASLLAPGEFAVLFLEEKPRVPHGWKLLRQDLLGQMICPGEPISPALPSGSQFIRIESLTTADIPAMLELVQLTEPGPFGRRTIELGGYLGIRHGDRLAAMAGQRLAPPGFTEVSAVCTHPDFRGRGYAQQLVAGVARHIRERGETPFLTTLAGNARAIQVYEAAGFVHRRNFELAVAAPPAPEA